MNEDNFDIVIIGGGCVGSGIALDATLRGYKVLLLEKNDFASGASSKSSKLVHGGVRYLEKAIKEFDINQFNLVKEGLKERAIFFKNASNIAKKIKINVPTFSYFSLLSTYIGLYVYKLIAKNKNLGKNHFLNSVVSSLFFPNLKKENLKGAVSFYDGRFLDTRMIISLLQTALKKGAVVKNYCEINQFLYDGNEKIVGVKYFDKTQNKTYETKTKVVINATGANVDNIRVLDDKNANEILALSSGIHIVISKDFLKNDEAILLSNTSDGRIIFILPYLNHCLIGTTDNKTIYEENPKAKEQEIAYLLKEVNNYFEKNLTKDDILSSWSGIRPLLKSDKNSTQGMIREHKIISSNSGLISICGGKWTTYRKMSEELVDYLLKNQRLEKKESCQTNDFKLVGNEQNIISIEKLMDFYPISKQTKESLKTLYGTSCMQVLNLANEIKDFELINEKLPYLKAEINYCVKYEFVKKPIDFLSRRIGLCFVNKQNALNCTDEVCKRMGEIFVWDEKRVEDEKIECEKYIEENF